MQECKKIIQDYVREVIVYQDHIEVIFNVAFLIGRDDKCLDLQATIKKDEMFKMYRKRNGFSRRSTFLR